MRTISASNPSSLKKPFCCARGNTIQWTTCCGTPTLILSAPRATPQKKDKIVTAVIRTPFIAYLRSAGSLGKYQRPEKLPRGETRLRAIKHPRKLIAASPFRNYENEKYRGFRADAHGAGSVRRSLQK